MTTAELIAALMAADPKGNGTVEIYENDGRVEGWSDVAKVEQGMPVDDVAEFSVIITVGECRAANSAHRPEPAEATPYDGPPYMPDKRWVGEDHVPADETE
jgi:hypothetical protein